VFLGNLDLIGLDHTCMHNQFKSIHQSKRK